MKKQYGMWFFDEPNDATVDLPPLADVVEGDPDLSPEPTEPTEPEPVVAPPVFDAEAFGRSFAESLRSSGVVPTPKKEEPPLSREEADKLLNKWKPTKEWYAKYDNLETREAAMDEMIEGTTKHNDTIAQFRMQKLQADIEAKYGPIVAEMNRREAEAREDRFKNTYKDLANPALQPVIQAVAGQLVKAGKTYTKESDMFKDIAEGVAAVIKTQNPAFKLSAPVASGAAARKPSIPVTTPGGGGGGGAKPTAPAGGKVKNRVLSVLGDVKG